MLQQDLDPQQDQNDSTGCLRTLFIAGSKEIANRNTNQWDDGDTLFLNCSAWDSARTSMATNIANSLSKGMRVIAQGRLTQRSYQAQDGSQRSVVELRVDEIGPALSRATAQVTRQTSSGFNGGQQGGGYGNNGGGYQGGAGYSGGGFNGGNGGYQGGASAPAPQAPSAPVSDPWSNDSGSSNAFGSFGTSDFGGDSDEPEF